MLDESSTGRAHSHRARRAALDRRRSRRLPAKGPRCGCRSDRSASRFAADPRFGESRTRSPVRSRARPTSARSPSTAFDRAPSCFASTSSIPGRRGGPVAHAPSVARPADVTVLPFDGEPHDGRVCAASCPCSRSWRIPFLAAPARRSARRHQRGGGHRDAAQRGHPLRVRARVRRLHATQTWSPRAGRLANARRRQRDRALPGIAIRRRRSRSSGSATSAIRGPPPSPRAFANPSIKPNDRAPTITTRSWRAACFSPRTSAAGSICSLAAAAPSS